MCVLAKVCVYVSVDVRAREGKLVGCGKLKLILTGKIRKLKLW